MNDFHEELELLVKSYNFWLWNDSVIFEITNTVATKTIEWSCFKVSIESPTFFDR